ncbi:hypothetical protein VTK73DRAFT_1034 [Phialemonium thermophilum]|uniref:N-acetyltransferase domain-containing protein n=1 Tax=Phialemonium thermophilum TaxID=223376 RepID=A0ABR3VU12_9PEZI
MATRHFEIRPATEADIHGVADIQTHYILNTVITFEEVPQPVSAFVSEYRAIVGDGLPYLVAVAGPTPERTPSAPGAADSQTTPPHLVVGYINAHPYRTRPGYRPTVEISIFCRPEWQSSGVGSALMTRLLKTLKTARSEGRENEEVLGRPVETQQRGDGAAVNRAAIVKNVLAIMAVDVEGKRHGQALKEFYERFGFVEVGYLGPT